MMCVVMCPGVNTPSSPRLSGSSTATDASPVCKAENNQQCWHWHLAIVAACYAQAMTNQLQGVAQGTTLHCASDHSCARQVYFNDSVPTFDRDVHWPVFDTDPDAPAAAAREQRLYLWNKKFVQHFVESTEPLSVRPFRKAAELQVAIGSTQRWPDFFVAGVYATHGSAVAASKDKQAIRRQPGGECLWHGRAIVCVLLQALSGLIFQGLSTDVTKGILHGRTEFFAVSLQTLQHLLHKLVPGLGDNGATSEVLHANLPDTPAEPACRL